MVIAIAGTDDITDWIDNFRFTQTKFGIHQGWYKAYRSIKKQIDGVLRKFPDIPIICTGHSAGGALANILTLFHGKKRDITLITFGSPKVGNLTICKKISDRATENIRIVHPWDIIPYFPLGKEYHHTCKKIEVFWWGNPHGMRKYAEEVAEAIAVEKVEDF